MEIVEGKPKIYNLQLEERPFNLRELMSGIPGHSDLYIRRGTFYSSGIIMDESGPQRTHFFAFRHDVEGYKMDDKIKGALADKEWTAIVSFNDQKITLLPTRDPKGDLSSFLGNGSSWKAKIGSGAWWYYSGGLAEALTEFFQPSWTFDSVRHCSSRKEYLEKYLKQEKGKNNYYRNIGVVAIITGENLSLEQVLQTISQKP